MQKNVKNLQCWNLLWIFVFQLAALTNSCNLEPAIIDKDAAEIPIVVSLLCPEHQGIEVYVARSFPEMRNEPVNNAQVQVWHDSKSLNLQHVQNGFYRNSDYQIRHGERYDLQVRLENGKILTGSTCVPQLLLTKDIQPGDTLWYERQASSSKKRFTAIGPEISWDGGQNAAMYLCYFAFADTAENQNQTAVSTTQSSLRTKLSFYDYDPAVGGVVIEKPIRNAQLVLCAIDSNFYQNGGNVYSGFLSDITTPDFSSFSLPNRSHWQTGWSNIVNGSGVFGAYTFSSQEVVVALREPY